MYTTVKYNLRQRFQTMVHVPLLVVCEKATWWYVKSHIFELLFLSINICKNMENQTILYIEFYIYCKYYLLSCLYIIIIQNHENMSINTRLSIFTHIAHERR